MKFGSLNEGLSAFTSIVGPPEAHYNVGVLLHQQGRTVEAEQHLQKALALKPDLAPASKLLSRLHRERGRAPAVAAAAATVPVSPPIPPAQTPVAAAPVAGARCNARRGAPGHIRRMDRRRA